MRWATASRAVVGGGGEGPGVTGGASSGVDDGCVTPSVAALFGGDDVGGVVGELAAPVDG